MIVRPMLDPFTGKTYDYVADTEEGHLLKVLEAACGDDCPPEGVEYLCNKEGMPENEAEVCAQCYRNWANSVGQIISPKAKRIMEAIELAIADECPPDTKDYLCQASEDEDTSMEQCARCLVRWATKPFGRERN